MHRNARNVLHQRQTRIARHTKAIQAVEFFNVLRSPELLVTTEALLPKHRERLYPPIVALSMFMRQMLETDGSCQKAVNAWAAQRAADGLCPCSIRTGGYCRARQTPGVGFPLARLVVVICLATGAALDRALGPHSGKGIGELGLVRGLLKDFAPGDVMVADALYCNDFLIATLMAAGVSREVCRPQTTAGCCSR